MNIEETVKKQVLINAAEHNGISQPKSVLGRIMAGNPELRERLFEIKNMIDSYTMQVNRMSPKEQKKAIESFGGYEKKPVKKEKKVLPNLERSRAFVVRFAPNPDGALHIGNIRVAILNDEYRKKYNGKFILRFDDTDPKVKTPEKHFYAWIKEDLKWLDIKWDKEVISSKRLPIYYKYAQELVDKGKAYVCTCGDEWKKLVLKSKPCQCRLIDAKEQKNRWKKMLTHEYKEGEAVLRIKTDLELKNPAVRDWPAMRIVDHPKHPLVRKHLWPLYNFSSAIDDHLLNITNILRGQEHSTNESKQRFIYQYFNWNYPFTSIVGRFSVSDMVMSKSLIRKGVEKGQFGGWDDLNLATIRSLQRRGFKPQAIRKLIMDIGLKPNDITVSMENLSAYNRKLIDAEARRYFFILDPKEITIDKTKVRSITLQHHPIKKLGSRKISVSKTLYIEREDFKKYKGLEIRLKDLFNIRLNEKSKYAGKEVKNMPKIHWLSKPNVEVKIAMSKSTIKGYAEPSIKKSKPGQMIQLESFGFCRVEKISAKSVSLVFAHT